MEKRQNKEVRFRKTASDSMAAIACFIEEKGYPLTAEKFAARLFDFGISLGKLPDKYPFCRNLVLAKHNLHCAVFNKTFIFIYKLNKEVVEIYNVVHGSSLK